MHSLCLIRYSSTPLYVSMYIGIFPKNPLCVRVPLMVFEGPCAAYLLTSLVAKRQMDAKQEFAECTSSPRPLNINV